MEREIGSEVQKIKQRSKSTLSQRSVMDDHYDFTGAGAYQSNWSCTNVLIETDQPLCFRSYLNNNILVMHISSPT
jgi:hypothetical protein